MWFIEPFVLKFICKWPMAYNVPYCQNKSWKLLIRYTSDNNVRYVNDYGLLQCFVTSKAWVRSPPKAPFVSINETLHLHCSVLFFSRNVFERNCKIEPPYIKVDWGLCRQVRSLNKVKMQMNTYFVLPWRPNCPHRRQTKLLCCYKFVELDDICLLNCN